MLENATGYSKIQHILEEVKKILSEMYGDRLLDIILYGSYARGDQHDEEVKEFLEEGTNFVKIVRNYLKEKDYL